MIYEYMNSLGGIPLLGLDGRNGQESAYPGICFSKHLQEDASKSSNSW